MNEKTLTHKNILLSRMTMKITNKENFPVFLEFFNHLQILVKHLEEIMIQSLGLFMTSRSKVNRRLGVIVEIINES